jgi:hypothetical protein
MLDCGMGETVRFSEVVTTAGAPEVYLPLSDPKHDRNFMRAVREDRALSLKQEPAGTKKDFGTVGYLPERFVTFLIFPKPLTAFKGKRVVGIKYDTFSQASLSTPRSATSARGRSTKPKPPSKPKPRPKRFVATVRLVATKEVRVTVEAMDAKEARPKALSAARRDADLSAAPVDAELLRVKTESPSN